MPLIFKAITKKGVTRSGRSSFEHSARFNGVFSRENLPKMKDREYVINLDDKKSKGTSWFLLFIDKNKGVYFDSFGIEYNRQEVLSKIKGKSITLNIFRIQFDNSIMCGFYCITFIKHMLTGKILLDYTNLFLLLTIKRMSR